MTKLNFNEDWTYWKFGDENNKHPISLPHDAMLSEPRTLNSQGGTNIGWFEGYDYVYEKRFFLNDLSDKEIAFEFEGIYHNAEIFVNDNLIAVQPNGYTSIYIFPSNLIFNTMNAIRVIARNSDQPNSRWYTGTGIYRDTHMYVLDKNRILLNGIKIKTLSYETREIQIDIQTNAPGPISVDILDQSKVLLHSSSNSNGTARFVLSLPTAELWNVDTPYLYLCRLTFENDIREVPFGIRKLDFSATSGFQINGERTILRGGCIHHDNGLLGACAYPYAEERKVALLKKAGYNAIRSAHNPCSKALLEACDKLGMLVLDEYSDMWYIHKTKHDYAPYVLSNYRDDLKNMIDKDYNHPSVIGYSLGNEVSETAQPKGIALCEDMASFCHDLDDTRPVTAGINLFFNYLSSLGLGVYSDKKADKQQSAGSAFFNDLSGILGQKFMKFGATLPGSDQKTKEAFTKTDIAGYNYGIDRYAHDLSKYPDRLILGTESFCSDTYRFYQLAKTNKNLIGDFVWSAFDYLGEVGLGAWEYKKYAKDFSHGPAWLTAGVGRIDITGKENGELAYARVAYELDDLRLAVVPVDSTKKKHSPSAWKMTNAIESWSWNGCDGMPAIIEVYSRAPQVSLYVNNVFIKNIKNKKNKKLKRDCRAVFKTIYHDGELKAVAFNESGEILASCVLVTASQSTFLRLEPERDYYKPSWNLCYIRIRFADENNILKPLIRATVKVAVNGGTLLALGNGCPYSPTGYLSDTTDTYYGEALAIVKPSGKTDVTVEATSSFGDATAIIKLLP
ncbi:MAG: DUF4982 domain-containing protein [Clostridiales bacterium]|jgi:beta-galactosidase|nr:DUF4982 domain-containing protein [Clostridiales bacterium]